MNPNTPKRITSFLAHKNGITSASFSPEGSILATGGYDCTVRLWDAATWEAKEVLPGNRRGHVAFSPDGGILISGGLHKDAGVFDTAIWKVVSTLEDTGGVEGLAFRPDGSEVILIEAGDRSVDPPRLPVEVWSTQDWTMTGTVDIENEYVNGVAFSPNGKLAAISHPPNGSVSIWSADFKRRIMTFSAHDGSTWGLAFSAGGETLATGGRDTIARLWNTASWEAVHELAHVNLPESLGYSNSVLCVAFSPDGKLLVTGGLDGVLTVWAL